MDKIKTTTLITIMLMTIMIPTLKGDDFDIGLTYYLLKDLDAAQPYFNRFFVSSNNQRVADAYVELFKGNNWAAAERFERYLGMNHRSLIAIVGMALSTRDLRNSTSLETLERALRLHPRSPAVHVAMGFEYFNRKDYPKAEQFFARALNTGKNEVYKIPLGYLFLEMNEFKEVLAMSEKNALADRKNFHFNYLAAKAHYMMNNWQGVGQFIQNAMAANPGHVAGRLLWAQFLARQNRSAEAFEALKGMHFEGYNLEYEKTLAQVLFELKDRQAYGKMLEVLAQAPWDKDINRMMGLHHLREARGENIQHWINRALIAGNSEAEIAALFPAKYTIKTPMELDFFSVSALAWFDDQYLVVGGKRKSGEKDRLYVIDSRTAKIVSTGSVMGDILQIRTAPGSAPWAVVSTVAKENQSIYLYTLSRRGNGFLTRAVDGGALGMPDMLCAFSRDGGQLYFVSSHLSEALYQAPFMVYDSRFQRRPLFPNLPLPVYSLSREGRGPVQIKGSSRFSQMPIKELRDFVLLSEAYQKDEQVRELITEGYSIDLAASRTVKAFCNHDSDGAIVYITDVEAKRGFDALLYSGQGRSTRINESIFMGKNRYAEVEVIAFNSQTSELLVRTLNEKKQLIQHHVRGKLTRILGENLLDYLYLSNRKMLYYLLEKKQKLFEKETQLFQVTLDRYSKTRLKKRDDVVAIQKGMDGSSAQFITFNGEMLSLDLENEFSYDKPALNTVLHALSKGGERAAFVNQRIVIGI